MWGAGAWGFLGCDALGVWIMRLRAHLGAMLLAAVLPAGALAQLAFHQDGEFILRGGAAGQMLGSLQIHALAYDTVIGRGEVFALPGARDVTPFDVSLQTLSPDALGLALTFAPDTGLPPAYLLVARRPADDGDLLTGTLIRGADGQQDWALVTLGWAGSPATDPLFDAPGFGVYALPFGLRNTQGARVGLRDSPRADAPLTHVLAPDVADLWVVECTPDIDGLTWDSVQHAARLAMLDDVWCKVARDAVPAMQGWVPGFFLNPL